MTPTRTDADFESALALTGDAWNHLGFRERIDLRRQVADAIAAAREQGRREMQELCAKAADDEADACERKRVVPGDLERNYFGGGLRASNAISAAIRALK